MEMRSVGSCRRRAPSMEKTTADQVGLASLGACRWGCGLSCAGIPDDADKLDTRVGRAAARCCISESIFPPGFRESLGRNCRGHRRKPLDDGRFDRGRHRVVDSGRHRGSKEHRAGPGLLFLPRCACGLAQLPGNHPRDLFRQVVRLWAVRGLCDSVVCHHWLLRQAARGRHRGHGCEPGGSRARIGCKLAAVDQLRGPAAGDAAHDRARPLPLRHQFP
jgi:hypothetical protein